MTTMTPQLMWIGMTVCADPTCALAWQGEHAHRVYASRPIR